MAENSKISFSDTELLRFITAGSVDDGKSTLIGRLLHDSKSIFEDQYEAIKKTSERRGEKGVNFVVVIRKYCQVPLERIIIYVA